MRKAVLMLDTNNNNLDAGPKAQRDISYFLNKNDFQIIILKVNNARLISKLFFSCFILPKFGKKMSKMNEIVIQYPMSRLVMKTLVRVLRKQTNAKIYCVTHDIESLRAKRGDTDFKKREIALLNSVDGLVVHNESMLNWLKKNGLKVKTVPLQLFDYDNPQPLNKKINYDRSISFAGNLTKSTFLRKFHPQGVELYLYGVGFSNKIKDANIHYQGSFSPTELPKHLTQSFGLVWDGDSINSCNGIYGQYTKYNDPHKASLYLSSGIPVIVWKKAGIAKYIIKHNLGIAIDSLAQLRDALDTIDLNEYKSMKEACFKEAHKMRNGEFITRAIEKLECSK